MVAVAALVAVFLSIAATAVADERVLERVSVGDGDFDARLQGINDDGTRAFFHTSEQLALDDHDEAQDVYLWTPGGVSPVSDTLGTDEERDAFFKGASLDGSRVFFETTETLTIDDTNLITDVYSLSGLSGVNPELERVSRGQNGGGGIFVAASANGARVYFSSGLELTSDDTDGNVPDVFLRYNDGTGAETTLVTGGDTSVNPDSQVMTGTNEDGTHFFFTTGERLVAGDTDDFDDVYEREGTTTRLVSTGGNGDFVAQFRGTNADGSRAFFETDEQLVGADDDAAKDVYERSGNDTTLVSTDGADSNAGFVGASKDGTHVIFTTAEALLGTDTDTDLDLYERAPGGELRHVSSGPTNSDPTFGATLMDLSDDGSRVFFLTDERLVAADTDSVYDMYERTAGGIALVSVGEINGNGELRVFGGAANADGSRIFFSTTEQLSPADTDSQLDVYERSNGVTDLVPGGNGAVGITGFTVPAEGDRVFIETAERLLPVFDQDQRIDVYAARIGTSGPPPPNPTPTPPGSGEDPPPGPDTLAPGVALSGRAVQRVVQQGAVVVFGRCDEACVLTATGTLSAPGASKVYRLRRARRSAPAGTSVRLRLRVPRKALSATRKALRRGRTVRAQVRIVALDAAGNRRTATRRIRARR